MIGPDGQEIRELFASEQAIVSEYEHRQPGYVEEHLEDILYHEEEAKLINIWTNASGAT